MTQERVLIIGLGEVGLALYKLLKESKKFDVHGFDVNKKRMEKIGSSIIQKKNIDVMHICYPCIEQEKFIQTYGHMEETQRFINLAFDGDIGISIYRISNKQPLRKLVHRAGE